jgi:hypothetical protein
MRHLSVFVEAGSKLAQSASFEVAEFLAAKRRRRLAVGASPRKQRKTKHQPRRGEASHVGSLLVSPLRGFGALMTKFRGLSPPAVFLRRFAATKCATL